MTSCQCWSLCHLSNSVSPAKSINQTWLTCICVYSSDFCVVRREMQGASLCTLLHSTSYIHSVATNPHWSMGCLFAESPSRLVSRDLMCPEDKEEVIFLLSFWQTQLHKLGRWEALLWLCMVVILSSEQADICVQGKAERGLVIECRNSTVRSPQQYARCISPTSQLLFPVWTVKLLVKHKGSSHYTHCTH